VEGPNLGVILSLDMGDILFKIGESGVRKSIDGDVMGVRKDGDVVAGTDSVAGLVVRGDVLEAWNEDGEEVRDL
jgi:hypothetical protein